jgi:hypothetical protein
MSMVSKPTPKLEITFKVGQRVDQGRVGPESRRGGHADELGAVRREVGRRVGFAPQRQHVVAFVQCLFECGQQGADLEDAWFHEGLER